MYKILNMLILKISKKFSCVSKTNMAATYVMRCDKKLKLKRFVRLWLCNAEKSKLLKNLY